MPHVQFVPREDVPNPKRLGHNEAVDIAHKLLKSARAHMKEYALFIGAEGEALMAPRHVTRYALWMERWPGSLCGVYTPEATDADIVGDVLAMDDA